MCLFFFSHTAQKHALLHQESYRAGCISELYSHAEDELIRFLIIFFLYLIHANQLNCVTSNKGICFFLSRLKVGKFSKANSPFNFALDYCNGSASLSNFAFGGTRYVSNLNTSVVLQRRGVSTGNVKRGILMVYASV